MNYSAWNEPDPCCEIVWVWVWVCVGRKCLNFSTLHLCIPENVKGPDSAFGYVKQNKKVDVYKFVHHICKVEAFQDNVIIALYF